MRIQLSCNNLLRAHNGGIQIRAGNVAKRADHRQHHQPERQRHANVRDRTVTRVIDDDVTGARADERKRSEKFSDASFHGKTLTRRQRRNNGDSALSLS